MQASIVENLFCLIKFDTSLLHRNYRKRLLVEMPSLNYLDESPCFPKDRRLAEAFVQGGVEAERAMREKVSYLT